MATLCFAAPARAGNVCPALPVVQEKVQGCSMNPIYAKAASICLNTLDQKIQFQQAALTAAIQSNNAKATSAQTAKIVNNSDNLRNTVSALSSLLAEANLARAELLVFDANLVMPGGMSPESARKLRVDAFLGAFPCYKDSHNAVAGAVAQLDTKIRDLQKTLSASGLLLNSGAQSLTKMDSASPARAPATATGVSAPAHNAAKKAPAGDTSSDITGTGKRKSKIPE